MGFKRRTESSFGETLDRVAGLYGWVGYHVLRSEGMTGGFPDRVYIRGPRYKLRLIVAELKLPGKRPRPDQAACLDAFASALGADRVFLWTPDDWPQIEAVLKLP